MSGKEIVIVTGSIRQTLARVINEYPQALINKSDLVVTTHKSRIKIVPFNAERLVGITFDEYYLDCEEFVSKRDHASCVFQLELIISRRIAQQESQK